MEIRKGRRLAVFFPHKEEWNEREQQHYRGSQLESFKGNELTQALSQHTTAHLVMVLGAYDKLVGRSRLGGIPMAPRPKH